MDGTVSSGVDEVSERNLLRSGRRRRVGRTPDADEIRAEKTGAAGTEKLARQVERLAGRTWGDSHVSVIITTVLSQSLIDSCGLIFNGSEMGIGKLIITLFHARTAAHILHLRTRSYAEHMALKEFYEGVIPLADDLAEAYQGGYELIKDYPDEEYVAYSKPLALLKDLRECVDECCGDWDEGDTHLNNICDEIRQLIASTQYKLRFLS